MMRMIPHCSINHPPHTDITTVWHSVTNTLSTPPPPPPLPFSIIESFQIDAGTMNDSTVSGERSGGVEVDAGADEIEQ